MNSSNIHLVHLSDDQILNTLYGDVSAGVAAHLANCSVCSRRVAEAEAPIASFKAMTLAWSERRSATLPLQPLTAPPLAWHRRAIMAATATAALLLGISVPLARHEAPSAPAVTAHTAVAPSSAAEVATVSAPALTAAMQHEIHGTPAAVEETPRCCRTSTERWITPWNRLQTPTPFNPSAARARSVNVSKL